MKIATFNINNINKRLPNLLRWLKQSKPDIVCLQELKCEARDFPEADLLSAGYFAVCEGQKSWNGVAILSRRAQPIVTLRQLPGDPADREARYIEAAVDGLLIASLYLPNGNPQPGPKFDYKMRWFSRLARHAAHLKKQDHPALLVGDFNVAPTDLDIYTRRSHGRRMRLFSRRPARRSHLLSVMDGPMLCAMCSVARTR
jgi:exodeoxyribonuclease III